ncbi:MAG: hypothetical protein AAGC86_07745 [Pseudomonadota bacterium]
MNANRQLITKTLEALFERYDTVEAAPLLAPDYIQHNPNLATGAQPILDAIPVLKEQGIKRTFLRGVCEGDMIVYHNAYENADLFGTSEMVSFDVFRVANGQIAEHWDKMVATVPTAETASGNSSLEGEAEITDLDLTAENKAIVNDYIAELCSKGSDAAVQDFVDAATFVQRSPSVGAGIEGLQAMLKEQTYVKSHFSIAEGNFVFVASEGVEDGKATAYFDLFRVQNSKIVEQWSINDSIPDNMPHGNGKF